MAPEPKIPEKPANMPKAPDKPATSVRAPPMDVNPRPISSHCISPNFLSAFARSSRPCTVIKIAPEPNIDENPANFPTAVVIPPTSASAPPIAAKPRPISSQDISAKLLSPSASSLSD